MKWLAVVVLFLLSSPIDCRAVESDKSLPIQPGTKEPPTLQCESVKHVTVCWTKNVIRPPVERYEKIISFTAGLLKFKAYPPVRIEILPYSDFEFRCVLRFPFMAKQLVGEGVLVSAFTEYDRGTRRINLLTYQPLSDKLLIHEILHPFLTQASKDGILNSHEIIEPLVIRIMTSVDYKRLIRQHY